MDHSADWQERDWLVRCESAATSTELTQNVPSAEDANWVFATDAAGDVYTFRGELVDGFLEVSALRDAAGNALPASRPAARQLCIDTLGRTEPAGERVLGWVMAARKGEEVNIPPVYPDENPVEGSVSRVVIFGDSLTDTGRLKQRLRIFPAKPYWIGRFSNGPAWPEYLAMGTGLGVQNHAYGGASVIDHDKLPGASLFGRVREVGQFFVSGTIDQQIDDYLERTLNGRPVARSQATAFLIWAGANDYISKEPVSGLIRTFLNSPEGESGYEGVVERTVAEMAVQVERLHAAGARRFVILNLPDLGRTPIVLQNTTYTPDFPVDNEAARRMELARRLTTLTHYHNELLADSIVELRGRLPGVEMVLVDSFDHFRVLTEPGREGREMPRTLGYDLDSLAIELRYRDDRLALQQRCYRGAYIGPFDPDDVCARPEQAVFWDTVHPTTLTHCWQAWTVANAMAGSGWIDHPPGAGPYLEWCQRVVANVLRGSLGPVPTGAAAHDEPVGARSNP